MAQKGSISRLLQGIYLNFFFGLSDQWSCLHLLGITVTMILKSERHDFG